MYPQVKGKDIDKTIMLYSIDIKDNTFNLAVVKPKFKQPKFVEDFKAQIKIKLDNANVVDKENFIEIQEK